jgi:hypothetical protein
VRLSNLPTARIIRYYTVYCLKCSLCTPTRLFRNRISHDFRSADRLGIAVLSYIEINDDVLDRTRNF